MERKKNRQKALVLSVLLIVLIFLIIFIFVIKIHSPVHKQNYIFETFGFPDFVDSGHSCTSNGTFVEFRNGDNFIIRPVSAKIDSFNGNPITNPVSINTSSIGEITPGQEFSISFPQYNCQNEGEVYSANITISFLDLKTNLTVTDNGTIIGVSS